MLLRVPSIEYKFHGPLSLARQFGKGGGFFLEGSEAVISILIRFYVGHPTFADLPFHFHPGFKVSSRTLLINDFKTPMDRREFFNILSVSSFTASSSFSGGTTRLTRPIRSASFCSYHIAREEYLFGLSQAHSTRQSLGFTGSGDDSPTCMTVTEYCVF